eukprot:2270487-Pyramimonas_sp.AAC.1
MHANSATACRCHSTPGRHVVSRRALAILTGTKFCGQVWECDTTGGHPFGPLPLSAPLGQQRGGRLKG